MSSFGDNLFTKTLNATDIHSTGKIYWKDFEPPLENAGVSTLSSVLSASEPDGDANNLPINNLGSLAMAGNVNMNTHNILDTGTIGCNTLNAVTSIEAPAISGSQVNATGVLAAFEMSGRNINLNSIISADAKLDFTGNPGAVRTFIEGDDTLTGGIANLTKCTYLDLSDGSNNLGASNDTKYEWGAVWTDATTNFPPPDGWRPYAAPQIPAINLVYFDFWSNRDSTKGWRFFAPMSDSDRQIDPTDKMKLHEGEYIHGANNAAVWSYAFYAETAPTLIASHSTQIVEFTFTSAQYGYGRIYIALAIQLPPYDTAPLVLNTTFRLMQEHEGAALANNSRINGPTTMKWFVPNTFPTNGTQVRIFPVVRTDDSVTTEGRLLIRIGNGQPLKGLNPGDPPVFVPENTNAQQSQLILRGYPRPETFLYFPNPPGKI